MGALQGQKAALLQVLLGEGLGVVQRVGGAYGNEVGRRLLPAQDTPHLWANVEDLGQVLEEVNFTP